MGIRVEAAAYNAIGGRKNNEDNFYLNGIFLKREQMDRGGKVSVQNAQPVQVYAVLMAWAAANLASRPLSVPRKSSANIS